MLLVNAERDNVYCSKKATNTYVSMIVGMGIFRLVPKLLNIVACVMMQWLKLSRVSMGELLFPPLESYSSYSSPSVAF
jgi:hypothetical protein